MLADLLNIAHSAGRLPATMRISRVSLIHKRDDPSILTNYRPISITSTAYRIFGRVLTMRLNECLPQIIPHHQTAYVPGRRITENIILADVAQHFAKKPGGVGFLLSVDFEKAFDRMDHKFLQAILEAWGLGPWIYPVD